MNRPSGGSAATSGQRDHAREVAAASAAQLTNVRTAAGRWQAGLAGLTGTIAIFGLLQGAEDVDALASGWGVAYGVCLAAALGCSIGGGVLAMRSAFGLPRVVSTRMAAAAQAGAAEEARRSAGLLHAAIWMTIASIAFVASALGIAWYSPDAAPATIRVHLSSGSDECGKVVRVVGGVVVLETETGERSVALRDVDGIAATESCSGG